MVCGVWGVILIKFDDNTSLPLDIEAKKGVVDLLWTYEEGRHFFRGYLFLLEGIEVVFDLDTILHFQLRV